MSTPGSLLNSGLRSPEELVRDSVLHLLTYMRWNNCYDKVLEDKLFEFIHNLNSVVDPKTFV